MAADGAARKTTETAKTSPRKGTAAVKEATARATTAAKGSARKTGTTARKATKTVTATAAAKAGRVKDAREVAADADLGEGMAARAIAEAEALHYQVEVNKRGLSVAALTNTLNQRWDNGWRLSHILEQRGNTVLVVEKRS